MWVIIFTSIGWWSNAFSFCVCDEQQGWHYTVSTTVKMMVIISWPSIAFEDDDLIISCALIAIVMKMMILLLAALLLELSWRMNLWCNPLMSGDRADFDQRQQRSSQWSSRWSWEWPFLIIYKTMVVSMMVLVENMKMKMTSSFS